MVKGGIPADAVKIDANENPMGPCPEALEAIHKAASNGGRYQYQLTSEMTETLAEQEGVKPSYVRAYPGSSAPLHHAVLAFCSPTKPFVMADPGYEQGAGAAKYIGAKTIRVPLDEGLLARREGDGRRQSGCGPDLHLQSEQPDRLHHQEVRHRVGGGE